MSRRRHHKTRVPREEGRTCLITFIVPKSLAYARYRGFGTDHGPSYRHGFFVTPRVARQIAGRR